MDRGRLPPVLSGLGALLAVAMAVELALLAGGETVTPEAVVTFVSSLPFVALLLGAGYWLPRSELSPTRYRRIFAWTLGGLAFLGAIFGVIAMSTATEWPVRLAMVRWAVSIGAGAGVLVGIFEGRAIERAVAAERAELRNEELRRRNERLDELASILSHDLRNPLNVASGNLELLAEERAEPAAAGGDRPLEGRRDRVETAVQALERMEQLLSETLALARSGRVVEELQTVRLADVAAESWENVATDEATLSLETDAAVAADRNRLKQLFENLFRNAVEHGGGAVTVGVGDLPSGFYVEDDGVGIPEEQRSSVFRASVGGESAGAGFGLAIVKQVAEAHGWEIDVAEGAGGGARFEVTGVDRAVADGEADDVVAAAASG